MVSAVLWYRGCVDGKVSVTVSNILIAFAVALCVLSAVTASGWVLVTLLSLSNISLFLFLSFGGSTAESFRIRALVALVVLLGLVICFCRRLAKPNLCYEERSVVGVSGILIADSSFSVNGNHMMRLSLTGCIDGYGNQGSASGVITVIGHERHIVSYGIGVDLRGHFSEGLFLCDGLQVRRRGFLNDMRERLITLLQRRLLGSEPQNSDLLSCALVLGRADEGTVPLREEARGCGCSHILALSGMHLGILCSISLVIFGRRKLGRFMSNFAVLVFVFLAGPRPSLVRAAILFLLTSIPLRERTIVCLIVQAILFPYSVSDLGCCYGYLAIVGLVFLRPYVAALMGRVRKRFANHIGTTVSILMLCIPLQMASEGRWHPTCLLVSSLMGFLAGVLMTLGLLTLVFGRLEALVHLMAIVYKVMETVLRRLCVVPSAGWLGYLILVGSMLLVVVLLLVLGRRLRIRVNGHRPVIDLKSAPNVNSKP